MPIGINLPVESIEQLAANVKSESSKLESQLSALRAQCQRDPNFQGNAAQRYDDYMAKWDSSQRQLLEALNGAGNLLTQFATNLRELNEQTANQFNL
jgi:WXG100 family type VII secretion target